MFSAAFWWAITGIILMICEFAVPGLILFFFGLGALITALLSWLFPLSLTVQVAVFVAASLVSLFGLRRLLKPVFTGRSTATSGDALVETLAGEEGTVSAAIGPGSPGKVRLHGTDWKAEADEVLEVGRSVTVVSQRSLTLVVKAR
jgi:membrane protein implicated in regulation of membrane protease activity